MIISFVGMSGAGKSAWSTKLEKFKKFKRFSIDELIERALEPELKALNYHGINGLSYWLGQPYDKRYIKNSRRYLELEAKTLSGSLEEIYRLGDKIDVVVDTTGSVIYLPPELLKILKKRTRVVYLETAEGKLKEMIEKYTANPKPVIWGDIYRPLPGETNEETLIRCYTELLKYRVKLYKKLADVTIDYFTRKQKGFSVEKLLSLIGLDD